jgi:hypothetical protein
MRAQLLVAGLSISALGVFFLVLQPFFGLSSPITINPDAGPAGTDVNVAGSGLAASTRVFVYWFGKQPGNNMYFFVASGEVGEDGRLASQVEFVAPPGYLGIHNVTAVSVPLGPASDSIPASQTVGVAQFNLTSSGGPVSSSGTAGEPSPLAGWGILTVAAGIVLAAVGVVAKERTGPIEPPPGYRFCVFCTATMPIDALRCPVCNGVQPTDRS